MGTTYRLDLDTYNDIMRRVEAGEPDPTPYGMGGDWCPFCCSDWKKPCHPGCESPYATVWRYDTEIGRFRLVNVAEAEDNPEKYPEQAPEGFVHCYFCGWDSTMGDHTAFVARRTFCTPHDIDERMPEW